MVQKKAQPGVKTALSRRVILDWIIDLPDRLSYIMFIAAGLVTVALGFLVFSNSVTRYLFKKPIHGIYDLSGYALFIMTFLSVPFLLKTDKHVSIDIFKELLPERIQRILEAFIAVCYIIVGGIVFYYSSLMTRDLYRSKLVLFDTLELPKYLFLLLVSLSFLFFFLVALKKAYTAIQSLLRPEKNRPASRGKA